MLRFENLSKRYSERIIFQGLHYDTAAGCVALNDESGSGKSTLLGILAGTIEPDAGEVWLGGHSLRTAPLEAKSVLTYVPEDCMTYPDQTGRDYLGRVASERERQRSAATRSSLPAASDSSRISTSASSRCRLAHARNSS